MKILFFALSLLLVLGIVSCTKNHEKVEKESSVEVIKDLPQDFHTPETLWKMLLRSKGKGSEAAKHSPSASSGQQHSSESDGHSSSPASATLPPKVEDPVVVFSAIEVILEEKNPGVLREPKIRISYPRGGGTLDLSQYVTDQIGTFFIRFVPVSVEKTISEQTFFWSRAKKRRIDDVVYGAGCNKILELGSEWHSLQAAEGFKVNTRRQRHVSVLGGRYVFVTKSNKEIFLSQIFITDSQHSELFCDNHSTQVVSK